MIRFDQTHIIDGLICGTVILDNEPIGEFRVSVPQWDELHEHEADDLFIVFNQEQAAQYRSDLMGSEV